MTDELHEKCAIFGVLSTNTDVARTTFYGLFALQHRGQEGSGMCVSDGVRLHNHKGIGLVSQVYDEEIISSLPGTIAIGHNRYSTSRGKHGALDIAHVQPLISDDNTIALAHNGNLPSTAALRDFLLGRNVVIDNANDSKLMQLAVSEHMNDGLSLPDAVAAAYPLFTGAFSLLIMSVDTLVAVRDSYGMRPFSYGIRSGSYYFASETCALETVGVDTYHEVAPGEMIVVSNGALSCRQLAPATPRFDVFEFVYFARPDSMLLGQSVYQVRWDFGKELAREAPVAADMVIPVPETAIPSAIGYAKYSGIPMEMALTKNRYIHRTFIEPSQESRKLGVRMKLTPLRTLIAGQRVIVIDDSIVRGTTSREIVKLLFDAGAAEVHFMVTSPPVRFPDFYGIDTPCQDELISSNHDAESLRAYLGATSLHFLSVDGMVRATNVPREQLSLSAFTGEYAIPLLERAREVRYDL